MCIRDRVTNGYYNPEPFEELLPFIDAMNIDLKSIRDGFYKKLCKARVEPVKATIARAVKDCLVEVTNLLVTGENDSDEELRELVDWLAGDQAAGMTHAQLEERLHADGLHTDGSGARDPDDIGMDIDWLASVPPLPEARLQRYRAARVVWQLERQGGLNSRDAGQSLAALFPGDLVEQAREVLAGRWGYAPFTPLDRGFRNEPRHVALIDAYRRAYQAKLGRAGSN